MLAACRSMGLNRPGLFGDLDSLGTYITQSFISGTAMADGIPLASPRWAGEDDQDG